MICARWWNHYITSHLLSSGMDIQSPQLNYDPSLSRRSILHPRRRLCGVSRAVFSRNSVAFREYFRCIDHLSDQIPGTSDESPIYLAKETPDNFRAMCWVFQLPPAGLQLQLYRDPGMLPELLRLRLVLENYGCAPYAEWVTAAISQHNEPPTCSLRSSFNLILGCPGTPAFVLSTANLGPSRFSTEVLTKIWQKTKQWISNDNCLVPFNDVLRPFFTCYSQIQYANVTELSTP
ncbi:hypothetical protein FB451DRAFT_605748 [Mycena latifolia]|nr:hypothetical protein FB451DRAFT_605748 [Mycena latifolia]